jgi:hypothetical protein
VHPTILLVLQLLSRIFESFKQLISEGASDGEVESVRSPYSQKKPMGLLVRGVNGLWERGCVFLQIIKRKNAVLCVYSLDDRLRNRALVEALLAVLSQPPESSENRGGSTQLYDQLLHKTAKKC